MTETMTTSLRVLRRKQVEQRINIARATLYDWLNPRSPRYDASFPKPIRLGSGSVGWLESEIDAWIESRVQARGIAA